MTSSGSGLAEPAHAGEVPALQPRGGSPPRHWVKLWLRVQADAVRFAAAPELTILCGHYKDVDQRVADHLATEELSLGDFVLTGGEPAALAVIDATVRLLPGAMSDRESAYGDSFWERGLSAPSYTRPPEFRGFRVPDVLLSGDHGKIARWRILEGERLTHERAEDRDRMEE